MSYFSPQKIVFLLHLLYQKSVNVSSAFAPNHAWGDIFKLNEASPYGDMMFFASLKMMLLHFVSQWCDVCLKMWRSHTSSGEAVIIGEANIICRRQTSLKKAKSYDLAFFMAGAGGFEPATHGFGDRYSTSWAIPLCPHNIINIKNGFVNNILKKKYKMLAKRSLIC